ncbi:MAG: DNA polymerase I [Candidatus Aerophobetes bacterium]|nr:DNA polymerase I [Candidatus Aerophobetes bacterium]
MGKKEKLTLIDGNALLYRAFYALPPLTNSQGNPTGAIYGFTKILRKLLKEEGPDYLACAFDKGKKTFRHKEYKEYKISRPKMPSDLAAQIPLTKEIIEGLGIPIFESDEYEADDLLGTLAKKAERKGLKVEIFTSDKDAFQIVSPSIYILRPKKGISETQIFGEEDVRKKIGTSPLQIPDFLALAGDSSDNIPGVPGIGSVSARKLIQEFGNLENLMNNLDKLSLKRGRLLSEYRKQAELSKRLATIITSHPLEIDLEELKIKKPKKEILLPIFEKLEFKELIREFTPSISQKIEVQEIKSGEDLKRISSLLKETPFVLVVDKEEKEIALLLKEETVYRLPLKQVDKGPFLNELILLLKDPQIKKIGDNLKQTILELKEWGINLGGENFDVQIAAYLLRPSASNYSLKNLSLEYLGINIEDKPSSIIEKAWIIGKLHPLLEKKLKKEGLWNLFFKVEMPLVYILAKMQERGIRIDRGLLGDFLKKIEKKRKAVEEEIYEEAGERFNLNSPKQLGDILFGKLHLPPIKKTKTGYSTDEEVLETLSILHPSVEKILKYRRLFKLESTYIKPLPNLINPKTGRIHTSFNQTVTSTGRLSSSQPNLQNIPIKEKISEELRSSFIADEGYLFLSADYSQIELRILAHLSKDANLRSAFAKNEDIHRQTAAEIFNILPLQVTPQMRRQAKVVNFGIIYGMSPYGLSRELGISQKKAEDYIEEYFKRYPKVKEYIDKTLKQAREKRYVTTLLGRKRYIPEITSSKKKEREFAERTAVNTPIQGGAADLIKLAMINLDTRFKEENINAHLILQIHDELLFEVAKEEINKTRKIVKEEMEKAMNLSVPLIVKTKIGKNWSEMRE